MKTIIISIFFIVLLTAGFSSKNQASKSAKSKIVVNKLEFSSLKQPDYKLVKELKALNTKVVSLNRDVNFYKEKLVVDIHSIKTDSALVKR
jgi:hypothetical protein